MIEKNILVFGGSGQIGRHLIRRLTKNNHLVTVVTRNQHKKGAILKTQGNPGYVEIVESNIFDEEKLSKLMTKKDICINLVGILYEDKKNTFKNIHVHFPSLISKLCEKHKLKQFIHLSALGIEKAKDSNYAKSKLEGEKQISESFKKMNTTKMELIQIHNLVDWKTQIKTLRQMKESGEISYIGITHYKSSAFKEMEDIIKKEPIDFAQFNYSIGERDAEERLLPICQEFGVATIINRPFMRGKLFRSFKNQTLPDWCKDYDINSWGQFFLKYIIANPAVTNIIPATSKSKNMLDNSIAGMGRVTDLKIQKRIYFYIWR